MSPIHRLKHSNLKEAQHRGKPLSYPEDKLNFQNKLRREAFHLMTSIHRLEHSNSQEAQFLQIPLVR
jgi:hypothetical protein